MGRVSKKQMRINHKKFVKKYLETGNASEAIRQVYPKNENPEVAGSMLLAKPSIQEAIQEAFEKHDRGIDKDIGALIEVADNKEAKVSGADKIRANELLLKLRGAFNQPNLNLNFSISGKIDGMTEEQAEEMLEKIKRQKNQIV